MSYLSANKDITKIPKIIRFKNLIFFFLLEMKKFNFNWLSNVYYNGNRIPKKRGGKKFFSFK